MISRIIGTIVTFALWGIAQAWLNAQATIMSAEVAGKQFENSNASAVSAQTELAMISNLHLPAILLVVILALIWLKPIRKLIGEKTPDVSGKSMALLIMLGLGVGTTPAWAFYSTTDVTEVVYILPNWSAFFIPDTGANKDSQSNFGSVDYLNANKIAAKRFLIPHAKLSGTGGTSMLSGPDYYIPTGRMIIVDRTPFFREWVDASDRGTSAKKQGFSFETRDSVNIGTGITVSAYVSEQNAAAFLYWFGTKLPDGDLNRPEVQFYSILRSASLPEVMDGIVRAKVQETLALEFSKRSFDEAIAQKGPILKAVVDAVRAEFEPKGITIGFLGLSGPLNFSDAIQASIDHNIVATRQKVMADTIKDSLPVLQQKAFIDSIGTLAQKWDGKLPALPSVLVMPEGVSNLLGGLTKSVIPAPTK